MGDVCITSYVKKHLIALLAHEHLVVSLIATQ